MNPVPTPLRENYTFSIQPGWNGVNVLNFPEGQGPNPVPHSLKVSRTKPPEPTTWYGTKATEVSPWYGVYDMIGKRVPSDPRRRRTAGFTLIEILVVIAIIGILTAIAIPAYISYQQRAIDEHMIRDLKNATIAMESYFADKRAYTTSLADLLATGFRQTPGVTMAITLTSATTYTMTATKPNGTKASFSFDSTTGLIQ